MWYCIIDLLTNSTSLLKYDNTGVSTLNLFYKMSLENNLPKSLRKKFINDFSIVDFKNTFIIKFIEMGLNIEKIVRMQQDLTETILSHNTFEIYGKTILESIDNYKHISNMEDVYKRQEHNMSVRCQVQIYSKETSLSSRNKRLYYIVGKCCKND